MKNLTASLLMLTILGIPGYTQQLSELFDQVKSSVVVIHVLSKQNTGIGDPYQQTSVGGLGSGVLVTE